MYMRNIPTAQCDRSKPTPTTSNADLWTTKVKGAAEEKVRRSYEAIAFLGNSKRLSLLL
jgi:hypothetical protein